ncbi:hypothetical protein TWF694_004799 [Orbilia ellipsospora]|uniref:SH3 domain-containing protein n=1 Tax=Orbilia ellipsospora TaxID=2528407 RepID=A0AAV9WW84_9PEZI
MDHIKHLRHAHHLRKREPVPEPQGGLGGTKTVVEVVFVTSPPGSDDGSVVTPNGEPAATPTPAHSSSPSPKKQSVDGGSDKSQTTMRTSTKNSSPPTKTSAVLANTASPTTPFGASGTLGSQTSIASPTQTGPATNSAGLTIGAYAGIVGGGVALILILIVAVAIILKKRQNSNYVKPEDEKNLNRLSFNDRDIPSPFSPVQTPKPVATTIAPKLEIRPMTQFDGSFFPAGNSDTLRSEDRSLKAPPAALSIEKKNLTAGPFETPEPSPAFSTFSDTSNMTLPIQGGGAPPASPPNSSPVHRVLVDFKPSMADELELKANEVVRLLHEYDDGWALCIRMDRTQQGVCPRTCLSPRPVKPRPPPTNRGPPPPQLRGPGSQPSPYSPSGSRPQSPGFGPGSRPQSPRSPGGPNRPPMSPKGMPGPPRRPDSRPGSPMGARAPHPLSRGVPRDDDVQYHAM